MQRSADCRFLDINECQIVGACDHKCFNLPGTFRCQCHPNYMLVRHKPDDVVPTRCRAAGEDPLILLSNRAAIRQYDLVTVSSFFGDGGRKRLQQSHFRTNIIHSSTNSSRLSRWIIGKRARRLCALRRRSYAIWRFVGSITIQSYWVSARICSRGTLSLSKHFEYISYTNFFVAAHRNFAMHDALRIC